jgi:hypothetical protein
VVKTPLTTLILSINLGAASVVFYRADAANLFISLIKIVDASLCVRNKKMEEKKRKKTADRNQVFILGTPRTPVVFMK